jgi:hypothetical protein
MLCFVISTVRVPESDFTLLTQLRALYQNFRETEDKAINFIDFVTNDPINIDSIFDTHDPSIDQKPHQPFQFGHLQHIIAHEAVYSNISIHSDYIAYVFRPPDACNNYQAGL